MPDLFYGDPIPLNRPGDFDLQKWMKGGYGEKGIAHLPPTVDPIMDACIVEMRTKMGIEKLGAVGYCFGAKYVVRHLRPDQGKFDVGYCAHPSFVEKDELLDIKGPFAISAAGESFVRGRLVLSTDADEIQFSRNRPNLPRREAPRDRGDPERRQAALPDQPVQRRVARLRCPRRHGEPSREVCKGERVLAGAAVV